MRVFYANFNDNSVPSEFSGRIGTTDVGAYNGIGTGDNKFSNYFLRSGDGATLSLTRLPEHDSIDLNFLFAVIDSWDGDPGDYNFNGDYFNIVVDGATVFRHSFKNFPGGSQSYNPPPGVLLGLGDYGFELRYPDSAYNLGLDPTLNNIPHTSSSLTIDFFANGPGWQGANNESWALENFEVIVNNNVSPQGVTISLGDNIAVQEGNRGQTNVIIPVTLSRASSEPVTVGISTVNGTATGGSDFTPLNQAITFSPNRTRADITVAVRGDTTFEPNETFFVTLNNPVGATIARGRTQITILNDDRSPTPSPQPSISIQNASITEGNSGTRNMVFNVRLSGSSTQTIFADYTTGNGTATAPLDYTARTGRISFAPGRTSTTIIVPVRGDRLIEPNETFSVSLRNLRNVRAGNLGATGTILNDDRPPTPSPQPNISIQNSSITEGNSGTRNMIFNVRLSGSSTQPITADYITGNGTATAPLDYTARSGRISFAPGRTSTTISIPVRGDSLTEPNETFSVSLRNLRNVRAGNLGATGTILNDDTRTQNIQSLSLGTSDNIAELSTKDLDYANVFGVDTGV